MECLRCGNKDPSYFYLGSKGYYCRKCVRFSRLLVDEDNQPLDYKISENAKLYEFNYELTDDQKIASKKCKDALVDGDVLLYCVCGAGKVS